MNDKRTVIIGAGPCGLGAAMRLEEAGADWVILEQDDHPGGLSASWHENEYTWDFGVHVMHSHYPRCDEMLDSVIEPENWQKLSRKSSIYCAQTWIPYPFQLNVWKLPLRERWACIEGITNLYQNRVKEDFSSFQGFIDTHFGKGIAGLFMNPYNTKVWGYSPSDMNCSWIKERVAKVDLERVIHNLVWEKEDVSWGPNSMFRFPLAGGTGRIWNNLAASLPVEKILYNSKVTQVRSDAGQVRLKDGSIEVYDTLINTMPLDRFIDIGDFRTPIVQASLELLHNAVYVVCLGIRGVPPDPVKDVSWMYFPESDVPFYRVTPFSNFGPSHSPKGSWSMMLEVSSTPGRPVNSEHLVEQCIQALNARGLADRADIVHQHVMYRPYGYPVPGLHRDEALEIIQPELMNMNILSRGRFGAWKYEIGNMDHSFMQGIEAVDLLREGVTETLWG